MAAQRAIIRVSMQRIAQAAAQATIRQRPFKQAAKASAQPVNIRLLQHLHVQVAQRDTIRLLQLSQVARVVRRDTIRQLLERQLRVFQVAQQDIILRLKQPLARAAKRVLFNH